MCATRGRCLVALLALYAGLDFANPLMPGAVYFAHGAVSVVDGARVAPEKPVVAPPAASSMERPVAVATPPPAPFFRPEGDVLGGRLWPAAAHRPRRRASAPAPLSDDH